MELLFPKEHIAAKVAHLGSTISADYAGKELVVVVILKGAFMFAADLIRNISIPVTTEFMQTASYHDDTCSNRDVEIVVDLGIDIADKHVLVIDDILDSGHTMTALRSILSRRNPASLRFCTLLDKKERREQDFEAEYVGMEIKDMFVVGYGLDHAGNYRQLDQIYTI